jgi:endonuclease-8
MPEGDTLWRTAAALRDRILGSTCRDVRPSTFARLIGQNVTGVEPYGKHLLITFDSGLALHSHLGMRGAWYVHRPGEALTRPEQEVTAMLTFDDWIVALYLGKVTELIAGNSRIRHLGPDILAEVFDVDTVGMRARADPVRAIGEVLLNQAVVAGIGNVYKCESLWAESTDPWKPVGEIDHTQLCRIYSTARRMMLDSALGQDRRNHVHGRAGRPCLRCSHIIRARNQGNPPRLTYWCPHCQTSPG